MKGTVDKDGTIHLKSVEFSDRDKAHKPITILMDTTIAAGEFTKKLDGSTGIDIYNEKTFNELQQAVEEATQKAIRESKVISQTPKPDPALVAAGNLFLANKDTPLERNLKDALPKPNPQNDEGESGPSTLFG
jgi:hypothetical protein